MAMTRMTMAVAGIGISGSLDDAADDDDDDSDGGLDEDEDGDSLDC